MFPIYDCDDDERKLTLTTVSDSSDPSRDTLFGLGEASAPIAATEVAAAGMKASEASCNHF